MTERMVRGSLAGAVRLGSGCLGAAALALVLLATGAARLGGAAQAQTMAATAATVQRGPETGLPLPRYVSLKSGEGRARRGPNRSHRVDWVFTRRDMPLRVTAEFEHWRRIEDQEGQGGWMHHSLLSGVRTALVLNDMTVMRRQPTPEAAEVALLERGVVARILGCEGDWCRLRVDSWRGWVPRQAIWGVDPGEELN